MSPTHGFWQPDYAEDIEGLAARLKAPFGDVASILNGEAFASGNFALDLQEATGVPQIEWLKGSASRHPVYFRIPRETSSRKPYHPWGDVFWAEEGKRIVAREADVPEPILDCLIYRTLGVKKRMACRLASVTEVSVADWLNNKTSTHPAFYGEPRKIASVQLSKTKA